MVAKDFGADHVEEFMHFIEHLRYIYLDEDSVGSEVEDMISFLAYCPEYCCEPKVTTIFRLSFLSLPHVVLVSPEVTFVSAIGASDGLDLEK